MYTLLAAVTAPLTANPLSEVDRSFLLQQLAKSRDAFVLAIERVSEAQWRFKPTPERWSIAETAEHIVVTEEALFQIITEKILKGDQLNQPGNRESDERVLASVRDRSSKFQAPERLRPTGRFATKADIIAALDKSRARVNEFIKITQVDLRSYGAQHPLGIIDAFQWFLALSAHAERHTAQIKEVQADAGYPK